MDNIKLSTHELALINKLKKEYDKKVLELVEEIYQEIISELHKNT
mgnify:FL=1